MNNNKIVIIGCGNVGMSYAYALLNQRTKVNEIILIDIDKERVIGEEMDLNHGLAFSPSKITIRVGDYSDCKDATIVCICAGHKQKKGETRLALVHKNNAIFKDIIAKVINAKFNGIFLIATNPVDVMTYVTYKESKFDKSKVIGTGTTLDTARLKYLISQKLKISPKNIHTYVIGEHGDSEFVPWSNAYISTKKINEMITIEELDKIVNEVKKTAYEIINKKGATYYAIGMVLTRITNAILDDENAILTVSTYDGKNKIFIGIPAIINRQGVIKVIDIDFNKEEKKQYQYTCNIIKKIIKKLK